MLLATDNGIDPHPKNSTINFTVRFIPMNGEPYFNKTEAAGNFTGKNITKLNKNNRNTNHFVFF